MERLGEVDLAPLDRVPQAAWDRLSERRVYFGHQSVGYNILAGVAELLGERPNIRLRMVESAEPAALREPGLVHSKVGTNTDAGSKAQAFANLMAAGAGDCAEAAFFKLCYADIGHETDVAQTFGEYERVMNATAHRFPRVMFLHATVPLTALPRGPKQTAKRLLGRPIRGYEHNIRRDCFNELLRKRFGATCPVFDIARIESTRPTGERETFSWRGSSHPAMWPGYTSDAGHLDQAGRRLVARDFLIWLAEAVS